MSDIIMCGIAWLIYGSAICGFILLFFYFASCLIMEVRKTPRKIFLVLPRYTNSGKLKWLRHVYIYHNRMTGMIRYADEYKDIPEKYRNEP